MKVLVLGCGTSTGVPRIGNDWGQCDPEEPRNRRSRVSVVVESSDGSRLLVDTSPDLRNQFLANGIDRIDAVFWTHDHADHCHGIDDLRVLRYGRAGPIPAYADEQTVRRMRQRFGYVFANQDGYPNILSLETLGQVRMCAGIGVRYCSMPHGAMDSTAFRFDADGKSIGYAVDFNAITRSMIDLLTGVDVLVVDCLRREPHPTHSHLAMSLELIEAVRAKTGVLTHLDKSLDYRALSSEVPPHVLVGYDGLEIVA